MASRRGKRATEPPTITAYKIDRQRYKLTPLLSNGQFGTPIELYSLFEAFLKELAVAAPWRLNPLRASAASTASVEPRVQFRRPRLAAAEGWRMRSKVGGHLGHLVRRAGQLSAAGHRVIDCR